MASDLEKLTFIPVLTYQLPFKKPLLLTSLKVNIWSEHLYSPTLSFNL